jgi:hypothetical protein
MSDRKTIQINPELFKIPDDNKTRKRRNKIDQKIKFKPTTDKKNKSVKTKLLKYIREKQEENYKKIFDDTISKYPSSQTPHLHSPPITTIIPNENENINPNTNNDFNDSIHFFNELSSINDDHDKNEQPLKITNLDFHNKNKNNNNNNNTIKYKPHLTDENFFQSLTTPISTITSSNVQSTYPLQEEMNLLNPSLENTSSLYLKPKIYQHPSPQYGCLKNGNLPTYRNYINKTKNNHFSSSPMPVNNTVLNPQIKINNPNVSSLSFTNENNTLDQQNNNSHLSNFRKTFEEMHKTQEFIAKSNMNKIKNNYKIPTFLKRKKTSKRTYHIGKSKYHPKVSVLVSNKTIRNKINTHSQLLKEVPIDHVKKYLIQNGFIKVGSNAPDDVLRKMYESANLIGGEIQNHNPENLLYNYLHN